MQATQAVLPGMVQLAAKGELTHVFSISSMAALLGPCVRGEHVTLPAVHYSEPSERACRDLPPIPMRGGRASYC